MSRTDVRRALAAYYRARRRNALPEEYFRVMEATNRAYELADDATRCQCERIRRLMFP